MNLKDLSKYTSLIRANQGHSIQVDVELERVTPPEYLWHGTGEKYVSFIDETGQIPKSHTIIIRKALMSDAKQIGTIHYKTWIETYTGMLPESYLATRSAEKSINLFQQNKCKNIVVAEVDGKIVGFCGWGEFRDADTGECIGEIQGIYLLETFKRNYIGKRLMNYVLQQLKDSGYRKVGLWVLDTNESAIRFYEKMEFTHNSIIKETVLGEPVTELFYTKDI